jgi:hypothetical protein
MPEATTIEEKKRAAKGLLDRIARKEELGSRDLMETLRHADQALDRKRKLTDEQLNRRAGY